MGTWGFNVLDDDVACDVRDEYIKLFNIQTPPDVIFERVLHSFAEALEDSDDQSLVWLGLARAQWECGTLTNRVLERVRKIVNGGEGMDRWEEAGEKEVARRLKALQTFLGKLETPNHKPRKPRKPVKRKPIFKPGDCLAIRLSDGDYAAALVLHDPPEDDDPAEETYGINLIALLKYKSPQKPGMDVFQRREWFYSTHHRPTSQLGMQYAVRATASGFKQDAERFELLGNIPLRDDDPKLEREYFPDTPGYNHNFPVFVSWFILGEDIVYQDRWDRGERSE